MAGNPADVVRGAYDAFSRGDIEGVLGVLSPTVAWRAPEVLPQGGEYRGREGAQEFFAKLAGAWSEIEVGVERVVDGGEDVVVLGRARGTAKTGAGVSVEYPFAHAWRVRDGLAVSFDEYVDPAELLAAGVSPSTTSPLRKPRQ
jgi:ketosteroid isomerase-like protein